MNGGEQTYHRQECLYALLLFLIAMLPVTGNAGDQLGLTASPADSNDGKTVLTWNTQDDAFAHIQKDRNPDFSTPSTLYRGTDGATVITGLNDGAYHFRGRLEFQDGGVSNWSPVVSVIVKHHSLARALLFFTVGLVVFFATLALIVTGTRRHGSEH